MEVRVNGGVVVLTDGAAVPDLLKALGLSAQAVAVAVNRTVVPRSQHATRVLVQGDEVEVVRAVGGG